VEYAIEMDLGDMLYIPSFLKTGSRIQKLLWGIHIQTHGQHGDLQVYFCFSRISKVG
jgi:hypothetical protein